MVELFHQSSDEVQHDKKPGVIILKETEWDLFFRELKIFRNDHKRAVKMALEDIKDNEEPEESSPLNQNKNWVIYVNITQWARRTLKTPETEKKKVPQSNQRMHNIVVHIPTSPKHLTYCSYPHHNSRTRATNLATYCLSSATV